MRLKLYIVDAFAESLFKGNPAAVCLLPSDVWLPEAVMQAMAMENNLSETVFFFKKAEGRYAIRWFTPKVEVALCGHATLATAHVLFQHLDYSGSDELRFDSLSGELRVSRRDGKYVLNFPADEPKPLTLTDDLSSFFAVQPLEVLKGKTDYVFVFEDEEVVKNMNPNFARLAQIPARAVMITAPSQQVGVDFVSRFFAPQSGIDEDPVTGSAHTSLVPYWAKKLGKNTLEARQLSARGGALSCQLLGERVEMAGSAVTYLVGEVIVPPFSV